MTDNHASSIIRPESRGARRGVRGKVAQNRAVSFRSDIYLPNICCAMCLVCAQAFSSRLPLQRPWILLHASHTRHPTPPDSDAFIDHNSSSIISHLKIFGVWLWFFSPHIQPSIKAEATLSSIKTNTILKPKIVVSTTLPVTHVFYSGISPLNSSLHSILYLFIFVENSFFTIEGRKTTALVSPRV